MCSTIFPPWAACCSLVASFKPPPFSALPPWLYLHFSIYPGVTEPGLWLVALPPSLSPLDYHHLGLEHVTRCNICLMLASSKSLWALTATMAWLILQGALHSKKWMQLSRTDEGGCCKAYRIPNQHALRIIFSNMIFPCYQYTCKVVYTLINVAYRKTIPTCYYRNKGEWRFSYFSLHQFIHSCLNCLKGNYVKRLDQCIDFWVYGGWVLCWYIKCQMFLNRHM